jgi:hypothetical protein
MANKIASKFDSNTTEDDIVQQAQSDTTFNIHSKVIFVVILLWVFMVITGYYLIHKPILREEALAVSRSLGNLVVGLAIVGLAGGIGRHFLNVQSLNPLERFSIQAAVGLGLIGMFWLCAGLLGGFNRTIAWLSISIGYIIVWRGSVLWIKQLRYLKELWSDSGKLGKTIGIIGIVFISIQLLFTLVPPTEWDALMYHLELPQLYLSAGRFEFISWNPYWGQPPLGEMLYTLGLALNSLESAAVIGWIVQVVLLLGLLGMITKITDVSSAWVGIAALIAGYTFRWMMSAAYVDGLAALFGFAALLCLVTWVNERTNYWLNWLGILAGFALWGKLTAGVLLITVILVILTEESWRSINAWKISARVVFLAILVFIPWLLITTANTGNPFYPHFFPTAFTSPERLSYFKEVGEGYFWNSLLLPLSATWFGVDTARVSGMPTFAADIGPLLITLAIPGMIIWRRERIGRIVAIWMIVFWVAIVFGGWYSSLLWQTRLYFVLIPAFCIAAGLGWYSLSKSSVMRIRLGRFIGAFVVIALVLSLLQDLKILTKFNPTGVLMGEKSENEYLNGKLGSYMMAMEAVRNLPEENRTIFLWEPRGLYAPSEAHPDIWIDRWYLDRLRFDGNDEILKKWRTDGFSHILIYKAGADFERDNRTEIPNSSWQDLDALLASLTLQEDFGGIYQLYSMKP